jgi:hypothetical protein
MTTGAMPMSFKILLLPPTLTSRGRKIGMPFPVL